MPDEITTTLLRKRQILADLQIDGTTLWMWVKQGRFPAPLILNPGSAREIPVWRESDYRDWVASLPQRPARRIGGRRRRLVLRRPQH
jgi:predicted DNA-binding transcriptional regulator AlpA